MQYEERLRRLRKAAGEPTAQLLSDKVGIPARTVGDWLDCEVVPRWSPRVQLFLQELESLAGERSGLSRSGWGRLLKEARQRLQGRRGVPEAAVRSGTRGDWLNAAEGSQAWKLVSPAWAGEVGAVRERTLEVIDRLAELRDRKEELLGRDPWYDPHLPVRTVDRVDRRLAGIKFPEQQGTLSPAEAALIVLLPFLHQVRLAWTADQLHDVDPGDLDTRKQGSPERAAYNQVLLEHKWLIRQAQRGDALPDRNDGRREVGWWLFHQWVRPRTEQKARLDDVLDALGVVADDMGPLLEPSLLGRLLDSAHQGARELFDTKRAGALDENHFEVHFPGQDTQEVRERLVGPLFAIAHAMAVEVTALPSVVVKHVGIPDPVDPEQLLGRLEEAHWKKVGDTLSLCADCDHPAVVAALTEHTGRVDALLREAHRSTVQELAALPAYAHADGVREVDHSGAPRQTGEVIRFRLDEERVQELLMGENLYRDRSLAIRELYQNALDACRYRRAIERKRNSGNPFQGEITFWQGVEGQRHFLECEDNGIGMDETVLAEVFSRAGVRFSEHARFREEPLLSGDGRIKARANSRFGIGVLSYFMLADEIEVTTRPMVTGNVRPEKLTVLITGPGHYFRVSRTGEDPGWIGTKVRLYLRDEGNAPSCVRELRRLLGIAEFATEARHEAQKVPWAPGALQPRQAMGERADGVVAHGRTVSWPPEGDVRCLDGQVVWCEHGGGILADGIFIEPRVRKGVLAGPGEHGRLRGAVVNLTGETRPEDLSVDRAEILDPDVDHVVERLIKEALPALFAADPPLLTGEWLAEVAESSPRLADLVTEAAGAAGVELEVNGHTAPVATVGFFPPDVDLVHWGGGDAQRRDRPIRRRYEQQSAVTVLWRLLAHAPNAELAALTSVVPELSRVRAVLPAKPSDVLTCAMDRRGDPWKERSEPAKADESVKPGDVLRLALTCGMAYEEVLTRMAQLRLPVPAWPSAPVVLDATTAALLEYRLRFGESMRVYNALDPTRPVPPGHLVKANVELNVGIGEAAGRMKALGFGVPGTMRTDMPEDWVARLLSNQLDGSPRWLDSGRVRAGHVLRAVRDLGREPSEIVERLEDYGFRPAMGSLDERSARELLWLSAEWGWDESVMSELDAETDIQPGFLVLASLRSGVALADIARRVRELGFPVGMLPDRIAATDEALLGLRENPERTPVAGAEVSLHALVQRAADSGLSPQETAERLSAYGLLPRYVVLPEDTGARDGEILTSVYAELPLGEDDLTTCTVPMLRILLAAGEARVSPQVVIDCLRRYGVRTSHAAGPARRSMNYRELARLRTRGEYLDWDAPVPLFHLVAASSALLMDWEEVIGRLVEFGLDVPVHELAGLTDEDLRLCQENFGPDQESLPLELDAPIEDFLIIAREADRPLDDLLPSLTRLGVDLGKVAEAVQAALPHVPGLVMAPEDDPSPAT
ncbi:hypothetical protein ACH47Z_24690 [Streptomyces sp. NPDC020192]|uniref:wHTH domain-containing protein n=1 Tax=Streptomyces sp. NPDC020192 TaxID=3365066 RepID=UPI0037981324